MSETATCAICGKPFFCPEDAVSIGDHDFHGCCLWTDREKLRTANERLQGRIEHLVGVIEYAAQEVDANFITRSVLRQENNAPE